MEPELNVETERQLQKQYWKCHSTKATVEDMMLDTQAASLDLLERPEILSALGTVQGKSILELGAGIGRFTVHLAESATEVIACDFMESLTEKNRKNNAHFTNITFLTEDATKLELDSDSLDVVFSNWLLMYLTDEEVEHLFRRSLSWLRLGGVLFFRESCYRPSGDKKRDSNPSHYRTVADYFGIIDKIHCKSETTGKYFKFKLERCANLESYVKVKGNHGQIYWKFIKVEKDPEQLDFRHFLDHVQYSRSGILRYEKVFGHGYVSTGGLETTSEIIQRFHLSPGQSVLDIGCGIGAGDFYLAQQFDVDVLGIDLSANMFTIAIERACFDKTLLAASSGNVYFEVSDCRTREFEAESFDGIYSRDALLHIHDKPTLLKKMFNWLKPGGQILITDYCKAGTIPSDAFAAYIKSRGYDLHPVESYGKMFSDAGFIQVTAEDATDSVFVPSLIRELERAEEKKQEILQEFSEADYESLVTGWKEKIARAKDGEQRWGIFTAKKP
eukprot:g5916.t1